MKMEPELKLAVIASIAAHAVLITIIAWGAYYVHPMELAGPGDSVAVWIASPEGDSIGPGGAPQGAVSEAKKKHVQVFATHTIESAPIEAKKGEAESESHDKGKAESSGKEGLGGDGNAGGGSVGAGGGGGKGNPILAAIWRKINAAKYYPPSARHRGIVGSPRVTFAINADGSIEWVKLASTCGETELDNAAIETVKRAVPLPYYGGPITLSIKYSLDR